MTSTAFLARRLSPAAGLLLAAAAFAGPATATAVTHLPTTAASVADGLGITAGVEAAPGGTVVVAMNNGWD
ncbi:hypothetical protein ACIPYS_12420 [Kitasatospora sp. NPDC089913]|uniref:hypothetical protein n=1 Tax=Kitasatospora sp. NPDC089913 TaxID=3364080 RepID=UPI0038022AD7